ncbi:Mucin-associated surface protein (MASP) [Trypanosoma cruzi]|uniref:Mucin-associated surface protein (MASP), putative n=2 Tax=Trypanosoma cruzi TaxID=5693 RepID=Q4DU45_TRYCC|nr:mucin-associated surface protein (MASP), putative [Trypanosoma cruzi]EAN96054.1 mucin-associated surface protein (MASP), putative [Trypanosoma cruzi]PWV06201.1 Mucin-associated surface protein (MASP) [Trypanosoma cruzi]RNC51556.1 mucin-associated surface protein (MASP) [Trypanosoma cruzi]|eukprot:XP_817905.1 mucin-associated surface protein (MASP) [Trypanosoma cruzi strain CL Brener]
MAMMMTGRVLLVCALCVLWCGAGGGFADEEKAAGSESGGELPPASNPVVTPPVGSQGLQNGVTVVTEEVSPISSPPQGGDADGDDEDEEMEDGETEEKEGKRTAGQSGQGGTVAPDPGSREEILIGSENEKNQSILSAEDVSPSNSRESIANPTQTEFEEEKNTDENKPAVEDALKTGNGENTLPGGGNLPSSPEDGVDSRKQDGEETTSENKKNLPLPATAATPQSHRDKGSEGTGEDTKATTVTANKTDTTNTQNSDSSTAVFHTTSPLLLLLNACAAAAAVVAA